MITSGKLAASAAPSPEIAAHRGVPFRVRSRRVGACVRARDAGWLRREGGGKAGRVHRGCELGSSAFVGSPFAADPGVAASVTAVGRKARAVPTVLRGARSVNVSRFSRVNQGLVTIGHGPIPDGGGQTQRAEVSL